MVVRVVGVEGDEGVVGQAFDYLCGLACKNGFNLLIHCVLHYSSADAVQLISMFEVDEVGAPLTRMLTALVPTP